MLEGKGFLGVILSPLAAAVGVEPAVWRADALEGAERAAAVECVVREAGAHQEGNLDPLQLWGPGCPPLVAQGTGNLLFSYVFAGTPPSFDTGAPHAYKPVLADAAGTREVPINV